MHSFLHITICSCELSDAEVLTRNDAKQRSSRHTKAGGNHESVESVLEGRAPTVHSLEARRHAQQHSSVPGGAAAALDGGGVVATGGVYTRANCREGEEC